MSQLVGHRPSLWVTKENRQWYATRTKCRLVGANYKYVRDQRLNVPSMHGGARDNLWSPTRWRHLRTMLNFRNCTLSALTAAPSSFFTLYHLIQTLVYLVYLYVCNSQDILIVCCSTYTPRLFNYPRKLTYVFRYRYTLNLAWKKSIFFNENLLKMF
jgi:hypothetical protein